MSEIKPALSPEEWQQGPESEPIFSWVADWDMDFPDDARERHALAALALHGQPFGFTWEDVDILRESPPDESLLDAIADRIAALLPPREP